MIFRSTHYYSPTVVSSKRIRNGESCQIDSLEHVKVSVIFLHWEKRKRDFAFGINDRDKIVSNDPETFGFGKVSIFRVKSMGFFNSSFLGGNT